MGSAIVPLGVILYIVASIIGAVIKALNNPPQASIPQKKEKSYQDTEIIFETSKLPSKTLNDPNTELSIQSTYQDDLADDWVGDAGQKDRPIASSMLKIDDTNLARRMREGFIMSEIFREPRSQRPWPKR